MDDSSVILSVVIPARNSERTIGHCLQRLFLSYGSLKDRIETIVVLDRCEDRTAEIVGCFPVQVISSEGPGRSRTRNTGARLAKADFICFIDSDSWVEPGFFSNLLSHLKTGNFDWIQSCVIPVAENKDDWFFKYFAKSYFRISAGTYNLLEGWRLPQLPMGDSAGLCVRKTAFESLGGFDVRLPRYEDQDLARRFFLKGFHLFAALDLKIQKFVEPKSFNQFYFYKLEGIVGLWRAQGFIPTRSQIFQIRNLKKDLQVWARGLFRYFSREISQGNYTIAMVSLGLPFLVLLERSVFWFRYFPDYDKALKKSLAKFGMDASQEFGQISNSKGHFHFSPFHEGPPT